MSRTFNPFPVSDGSKMYVDSHWQPLADDLALLALGCFGRNQFMGGSRVVSLDGSASGSVDVPDALEFEIDNTGNQISDASNLVVQVRLFVRVSNAGITVTPRIYDVTAAAAATISGAAACSATAEDYSGPNQKQTVTLTLPNAKHKFKPQLTIGGTPAAGYEVWGHAIFDCYVDA